MTTTNPWGEEDRLRAGQPHRVALGGLQAFVQRNKLTAHAHAAPSTDQDEAFSSLRLIHSVRTLYTHQRQIIDELRELECLEQTIASAGSVHPQQLQNRLERVAALRDLLRSVLAAKPILLGPRRKSGTSESLRVGLAHQQTFIDVFCKIGDTLPSYAHMLGALGNLHLVSSHLTDRQNAYKTAVESLETTIAQYQTAFDELNRLRGVYSQLQQ